MIGVTKKTHKSHSPSQVYAAEGVNIIEGFKLGMAKASKGMMVPTPGLAAGGGVRFGRSGPQTVVYQTVNAHHSESLMTTLGKANFRLKHR